jgi:uncharacterized membrane protein
MNNHKRDNKKFNNRPQHGNPYNILPPTNILEEYEDLAPGSVNKLVEMAKKEQEHRHEWQENHLMVHGKIHKWGQIFAFTYNVILLFVVLYIANTGNTELAVKLFTINAVLMGFALLVTFVERRIMNRRPPRRFPHKPSGNANPNSNPNYKGNNPKPNNNRK